MPLHSDGGLYFFILVLGAAGYMIQDMEKNGKTSDQMSLQQGKATLVSFKKLMDLLANTIQPFRQISKVYLVIWHT